MGEWKIAVGGGSGVTRVHRSMTHSSILPLFHPSMLPLFPSSLRRILLSAPAPATTLRGDDRSVAADCCADRGLGTDFPRSTQPGFHSGALPPAAAGPQLGGRG